MLTIRLLQGIHELADDEFKRLASAANNIDRDALIQGGEFALFVNSQAQEIDVRDLSMGDDRISYKNTQNARLICPEMVTG